MLRRCGLLSNKIFSATSKPAAASSFSAAFATGGLFCSTAVRLNAAEKDAAAEAAAAAAAPAAASAEAAAAAPAAAEAAPAAAAPAPKKAKAPTDLPFNKPLLGAKGPDPEGLREFSVVYTDKSLNHMSAKFVQVMKDLSTHLCSAYNADQLVVVPGSGTFAMEAVARQLVPHDQAHKMEKVMVLRNGLFGHRWVSILDQGNCTEKKPVVMNAHKTELEGSKLPQFQPAPIDQVVDRINKKGPSVVFCSHVDTSTGVMLPDSYISKVSEAVHGVGGILVLDCIASGMLCPDTKELDVDVLITAPQKGWSGPPCCGLVLLNECAEAVLDNSNSTSFALDLKKWAAIMQGYLKGTPGYHTTMPTDALCTFRDIVSKELEPIGFKQLEKRQKELGARARELLKAKGFTSVAADGFGAPGVIVAHAENDDFKTGKVFKAKGVQIAGGVPLHLEEGADYKSFRIGLFGVDKLRDVEGTLAALEEALDAVRGQ